MRVATPSHAARRLSWRALAGAIVLAGTLTLGAIAPSVVFAQDSSGGYLGYDTPQFAEGQSVAVQTDDGGGLSLRLEPNVDAEQLSALRDGAVVTVVIGPEYDGYGNGWYLVTDGALRAYAYAGFLIASGQQTADISRQSAVSSQPSDASGYLGYETPQFNEGATVVVQTDDGGGLNLRAEPGVGAEALSAARDGATLTIVDGPVYDGSNNGWYLVTDGSLRAYAFAGFLAASSQQPADSSQTSVASSQSPAVSGYLGYETPQLTEGATVVVQTDDGGGLSLRADATVGAEKLSAARDGSALTIVSGPVYDGSNNGWYLVTDGSIRAYAFAGFLAAISQQPAASSQSSDSSSQSSAASGYLGYETPQFSEGQTVEVVTDDGGGLSLRAEPGVSAEQLVAVRDGTIVTIVDGPVYDGSNNGWYLVTNGSIRAYAFAGFLVGSSQPAVADGQSSSSSNSSSSYLGFDTPEFSEGQRVEIRTDDGGGLSLRSEPDVGSEQLAAVRDGSTVTIVDGPVYDGSNNGWYLVNNGSIRAYAYAGFLAGAASNQQPAVNGETSTASNPSSGYLGFDTPQFSEGQSVEVQTDDGGGLSLRSEATAASQQLRALRDGAVVTFVTGPVYDGANNGWYLVSDGSIRAYAYAGFLIAGSQQPAASSQSSSSSSSSSQAAKFAVGDTATTEGTTNVRNGASVSGSQLGTFSDDDIVEITDGPFYDRDDEAWYYIVGDSVQGFVMGDFLIAAAAAASEQAPSSSGATGSFIYPLASYTFTQGYGCSQLGFYAYNPAWGCRVHNGIDLAAPSYTPILASDGGTVVEAGWCDCGLGYYVKIDHGNGLASLYGHMAEMPYVRVGQSVNQGDTIGPIGSTGLSTGPHTHFMIQQNGVTVNPLDYL
ncbi:hypothetical protein BH20CHL4_BH20CHL4_05260 [soil metagenome]